MTRRQNTETNHNRSQVRNPVLKAHLQSYRDIEAAFEKDVAKFGLPFEQAESASRQRRLAKGVWSGANNANSLWLTGRSPACIACAKGIGTKTFFISLKCTRDCYFCFNSNQEGFEYFLTHTRAISDELRSTHACGAKIDFLAITGGEPLLHLPELLRFLGTARELYPHAHLRLYTSGDTLTEETLLKLAVYGLDEMRFSVKQDDSSDKLDALLRLMELTRLYIPSVLVEMPVIPGTLDFMKTLLVRLDATGITGINLLEFGFPLNNAEEYRRRGFKLRKNPYYVLYNYWYAGGIPVAGSEFEALELLRFSQERNLRLGVHYCSLDNKNTGQIYQQNYPFASSRGLQASYPGYCFDETDFFIKAAKAFGADIDQVLKLLGELGCTEYQTDESESTIAFPLSLLPVMQSRAPTIEFGVSLNVLEDREKNDVLREVHLALA